MNKTHALLVITGLAAALQAAQAGDITGTVTLKGTPPPEKEITPLKDDPNCGKLQASTPMTHFYVAGPKGELGDVVVSLHGVSGKFTGATASPAMLDQKNCLYSPYIMAVQTDQKILIRTSDPVLHNVHTQPTVAGNTEMNQAQMEKAPDITYSASKPEEFLKFKCDVHPWMFAYVSVFDHPYFAVTGKDGTFKIANVPAGKYTIEASHRKAGKATQEIEVKEGETKVELTLEAK
jgi:hypothetical protein